MDTLKQLNREFSAQDFSNGQSHDRLLDRYRNVADNYARMENAIAVLSDLRANVSYLYFGGFAQTLGLGLNRDNAILSSIWEEEIFSRIHPDDLDRKHLQELCFFHFIKRVPRKERTDLFLMSRLRMRLDTNGYIPVLHRMFYVPFESDESLWLALCLYSPLFFDMPANCLIVNSRSGDTRELGMQDPPKILSPREKQILGLIDKGLTSKEIADLLCISIHTVSRHRQEIREKLQVKNSIEACRIAKELKLL